jgi:DNA-binding SARP family transcriptional activator/predicted ATPase/Tfp pilus assembly protein PilF
MLEISLLGEIIIRLDGEPITRFRSQKEIALLAYLAHTGQTHGREALADLLWEARSTKQSLSNLRTALARLRKRVGDRLIITRKTVAVTPAVHELTDTARFQAMLAGGGKEEPVTGANLLAQGLELYSGEFMAGFSLAQTPRFNDWLVVEQERLRQVAMRGYRQLAGWQEEQGAFSAGVITAQRWVSWDPLDETAQQQLMRLLVKDGRVAEALAVYEKCWLLLQTELGIPPAPATTALYKAILDGSLAPPDISPAPLHNLPRALMPLYGRKKEIKKLTRYLVNPEYPIVSITGVGGMGKTSLALASGRRLVIEGQHPFKDGIWFVSLAAIENDGTESTREEVAALVGQAMGLFFHGENDLWAQLLGQLGAKSVLLILDNIEQFLTAASDLIVDLLGAGEDIHLLVTSRTTPAMAASVAFPLTGLETPAEVSVEALSNESVRLFAERSGRMPAPFHVENHLAEVVAICQFVEGMPLGIELTAASLGRLMVDEIMPALRSNLQLLNSKRRDLPPRQRTFQAVFDSSWQLLDAREQAVLAQISIFRGGFTRQAAEAVLNETASGLYNLQHHALLRRDEKGRFRMHSLLRQLAREKLSGAKMIEFEGQAVYRHSIYFADFLQSFEDELQRGVGKEALRSIMPEVANMRAAWLHAVEAGEWQALADCLNGAHYFYKRKGFFSEEAALIDSAISSLQDRMEEDDVFLMGLLSRLLTVRAWGHYYLSRFEEGAKAAERACERANGLENPGIEGQARLAWAQILYRQRKHEQASAQFEQVVALARTAQNQILEADGLIGIGSQILWQADVKPAQEPLLHALSLCQMLQYKPGEVETLILLGGLALRQEAFALSVDYDEQALQLSRLLGDVAAEAEVLGSLGVGLSAQGDLVGSLTYQKEALATFRQLNMPDSEQWVLGQMGYSAIRLGDYAGAERNLTEALSIARQLKDEFWQAWVKLRLGEIWIERGEAEKGLPFIIDAFETAVQVNNPRFQAAVLYDWGNALLGQADWAQAEQKYQKAYELRLGAGQSEQAMPALAGLAYVAYQQKMWTTAAVHAEQLWQTWQESPSWTERADLKLYWQLGMVWDGLGDCRIDDLWNKAHALLQKRCEMIPDENGRKMFLEQVTAHRAILKVVI